MDLEDIQMLIQENSSMLSDKYLARFYLTAKSIYYEQSLDAALSQVLLHVPCP